LDYRTIIVFRSIKPISSDLDYEVREYRPGDEDQIVPLLQLVFDGWRDLDFWRWKYLDNPLKMNIIAVAESDGRIIGTDGAVYKRIKVGDNVLLGNYGTDGGVHPDFRRIGVFKNISILKEELRRKAGIEFNFFCTDNPIIIELFSKTHLTFPYFLLSYNRIKDILFHNRMNPTKSLSARLRRLGRYAFKLLHNFGNILFAKPVNEDIRISEISEFDYRAETFWGEIRDHYDFIVERIRDYLNWNYCDPRGGDFTVKLAEEDGRMLGYVVLETKGSEEYPRGEVVDLLTVPGRIDAADALLKDANRFFDDNDINLVTSLVVEGHPFEMVFKRHGFRNIKRKMHVFYQCPKIDDAFAQRVKGILDTTEAGKVHLSSGDLL